MRIVWTGAVGACAAIVSVVGCSGEEDAVPPKTGDSGTAGSSGSSSGGSSGRGSGGSSGTGGIAGSGGIAGTSGSSGTTGSGGSTDASAGTGGGPDASAGTGGGPDASGDTGATDASPDACPTRAVICSDFDQAASSYDLDTKILVLALRPGGAEITAAQARISHGECTAPTVVLAPLQVVDATHLRADLTSLNLTNITLCAPIELSLTDACLRSFSLEIGVSYFSEGNQFRLTCPSADGGTDAGSD